MLGTGTEFIEIWKLWQTHCGWLWKGFNLSEILMQAVIRYSSVFFSPTKYELMRGKMTTLSY